MAGVYIHIPFCRNKCNYCNFYSVESINSITNFINALKNEINLQKNYLGQHKIATIYLGGGTPSVLQKDQINKIIAEITNTFLIKPNLEITIEINPNDVTTAYVKSLKETAINRISIGTQSFSDIDLNYLGRIHNAKQALNSIYLFQQAGFENISIDLIYGIPNQTNSVWKKNIETAVSLGVKHISAYALTVENTTPLFKSIQKNKVQSPDENVMVEHFEILMDMMKENEYIHYEISNFCKENFYSQHNSAYWKQLHYLGLGPSAHSYNGNTRQWNTSNVKKYIENLKENKISFTAETLTDRDKFNEYILTRLRTIWGINMLDLQNQFGEKYSSDFEKTAQILCNKELLKCCNNVYILSQKGKLVADKIICDLFVD